MKNKELLVVTERTFSSKETPKLKITARNIPELKFRAYRIDMETYFKKYHDFRGVENLDIALIDPDITWEYKIPDYQKMQSYDLNVAAPDMKPGAYAITLGDEELEATTLLLVTDVAAVIKSSRNAVFVYAQDTRTGQPVSGARVLISNGAEIFEGGHTGGDGVYQYRGDKISSASNMGVLIIKDGGIASNKLSVGDIQYVASGRDRGIIYTERPAYRPGQTVKARGILRNNKDGVYSFQPGASYTVSVLAPGGIVLHTASAALSEFGALSLEYNLSPDAAPGTYGIQAVGQGQNPTVFSSSFLVQEYKLERVKLSVNMDEPLYFRGETARGKIKAEYYFGEPVANKKIEYRIGPGSEIISAETDANGEIAFSFETGDYDENVAESITAIMSDENVTAVGMVWIAATGFTLNASTLRDVYLAGESVEVTVKATDLSGKPAAAQDLRLEVLHRVEQKGTTSEVRVRELPMTQKDPGVYRATVTLNDGGSYVLRAFARDKFNNPVVAETYVFLSGDDDTNRVRVITEREELRVGETPMVTVVFREDAATALLTYEGEAIYKYETVKLKKGENRIKLNITDDLAPNFTLGVSVMSANRFHQADKTFDVIKGLVITLEPDRESYTPGQSMKLKVRTTDQDGRPVRAELSLALVDEALYTLFADNVPKLNEFFFGARRAARFKTISSNTFSYDGVTREAPKEVIAEGRVAHLERSMDEYDGDFDDVAEIGAYDRASGGAMGKQAPDAKAMRKDKKREAPSPAAQVADGLYGYDNAPAEPEKPMGGLSAATTAPGGAPAARLRDYFPETGYWNPAVDTGANGSTSLDVTLPDTATTWRLTSRGTTAKTLVGEATIKVVTKQDFFIQTKHPAALVEGSTAGFIIDVHNLTATDRSAVITATLDVDGVSNSDTQTVSLKAGETGAAHLQFKVGAGRSAVLTVDAKAGDRADKIQREIPVSPYGAEIVAAKSGVSSENTSVTVGLSQAAETTYPEMKILISPGAERSVLDIAFPGPMSNNSTALEAIATAYKLEYLNKTGAGQADRAVLASRLKGLCMRLVTNSNQGKGTWNWTRRDVRNATPDMAVTGNALWALALARRHGVDLPPEIIDQAAAALEAAFTKADTDELKAELQHALSLVDRADFAYVNRLDRVRSTLTPRALSFVALSYVNMNRPELAADIAEVLAGKIDDLPDTRDPFIVEDEMIWRDANADVGLAMLAMVRSKPASPAVRALKQRVEALRWGSDWGTPEATMAAATALAAYYSSAKPAANRYSLKISVNGTAVQTLAANSSDPAKTITVPRSLVQRGDNKVSFALDGRGEFAYSVVVSGFTKVVPADIRNTGLPYVYEKRMDRSPPRFQGKEFKPGADVLRTSSYDSNGTTQVVPGDYVTVELSLRSKSRITGMIVVQDSFPAGCTLDKDSITGGFQHYELRDNRITFYCQNDCDTIQYKLYGYLPGTYAMPPVSVAFAANPWTRNYQEQKDFTVLPSGEAYSAEYKLTPDQLYNMGKAYFDAKLYEQSASLLDQFISKYDDIREEPFKETHRMLMYVCIERDDSKCIVSHFEQLKERYPELSLNFEDMLRVGKAYHDIKESERAIEIYRTVLESSFMTDGDVRVFLENQGKFLDSIAFLDGLVREYPDLNIVENAAYSTGHILFQKAAEAESVAEFQEKKLTKRDIASLSVKAFGRYMLFYPDSAYIDEASFSLASVYFDVMLNDKVIGLTSTFRKRYPASPFLDSFEYLQAYAHFESQDFTNALNLCRRVAEGQYATAGAEPGPSDNRNIALYLTAQIYHAMNKPDKAAENYEKVAGNFADAAGALDYFNRVTFQIPELTTIRSGKKAALTLTHRNVKDAEIQVYRVDLLKFYLMRKNLEGMADIQLSGVKPIFDKKLALSKGREYRDRETALDIPLTQDGAYLVVLRSGNQYVSGMLLRSNLEVEVQEDDLSGRVRVNVLDGATGRYVSQASVKVVGSEDGRIQNGSTDLRGIFTAEGVSGRATAIVKKNDQYAFFSGQSWLQAGNAPSQPMEEQVDFEKMRGKNTEFIYEMNEDIQMRNKGYINDNLQRQQGIQIQQLEQNVIMQK
jgi:hypothetical protein